MSYTVNKTNTSASPNSYTVQDGVVNTQTDLSLIGKGYAGYGELIAENFLHLLENFSNSSAPSKPISGQLWFDSANNRIKVYTGSAFIPAGNTGFNPTPPPSMTSLTTTPTDAIIFRMASAISQEHPEIDIPTAISIAAKVLPILVSPIWRSFVSEFTCENPAKKDPPMEDTRMGSTFVPL